MAQRVWYAAFGSNMDLDRLRWYLSGGTPGADDPPAGGGRAYPGCRDPRPPARSVPVELPGLLYFATYSPVWRGARAFYDPDAPGRTPARAHLLTPGQFSDIAAQEMHRDPGEDLDLSGVLRDGRARLGPGRYETLVCPGTLDGDPLLTFTAPWSSKDVPPAAPAAAYLRRLGAGLMAAHGWDAGEAAAYLATRPGAEGTWERAAVRDLLLQPQEPPQEPQEPQVRT